MRVLSFVERVTNVLPCMALEMKRKDTLALSEVMLGTVKEKFLVVVEIKDEDVTNKNDVQLKKGIEVLEQKISKSK